MTHPPVGMIIAAGAGCGRNFAGIEHERTAVAGAWLERTVVAGAGFEGTVAAGELERTAAALLLDLPSILDCGMLEGLCLKKEYLGK